MSDFFNPHESRVARKPHRCIYCAEPINVGDRYVHQTGVYDGAWFTSKTHPECFQELCDDGNGEFTPYSNERPKADAGRAIAAETEAALLRAAIDSEVDRCAELAAEVTRLTEALTEIRDRIKGHPAYADLTEAEEIDVGGDTAEFSYLARLADVALLPPESSR